jgi:hypothetical protein
MRLTNTVKQWLTEMEWSEAPEIDNEKQTSSTVSIISIGGFNLKIFLEAMEEIEVFKIYAYSLDTKAPEKRLNEVQKLITTVSSRMTVGTLHLLREDRVIRYYGAIDVENAAFEPAHITNLFKAGLGTMEDNLPRYMSVCFGGKTADEALETEN